MKLFFFLFYISFSSFFKIILANKKLNKLWYNAENKDLITSIKSFKILFQNQMDKKETKRFQEVQKRLSLLLTEELKLAENYSNKQQFNSSVIIYQNILNYMSEMLDQNNLKYIQDQLSESIFRLTLGGHVEWIELEKVLKQIQKRTPYQDYLIRMSQANTANKNANWKPKKNTFIKSDTLPYVLRFFTPQKYHTPTLAHFGHVSYYLFIYLYS